MKFQLGLVLILLALGLQTYSILGADFDQGRAVQSIWSSSCNDNSSLTNHLSQSLLILRIRNQAEVGGCDMTHVK